MKINPSLPGLDHGKSSSATQNDKSAGGAGAASPTPAKADTIHLSALSTQLHALEATLTSGGEFDRTKVDAIKVAIREGRLMVNSDVVADKMMASTLASLGKATG